MTPSRLSLWLLHRLTTTSAARAILGDIIEALEVQQSRGRVAHPRYWLERETWKYILPLAVDAARRGAALVQLAFRDAWRALRSSPRSALFIFGILTAAISTATVTFSVVDAVVLRPLPYDDPRALVVVTVDAGAGNPARGRVSAPELLLWQERSTSFEGLAATRGPLPLSLGDPASSSPVVALEATRDLFGVLRAQPFRGRLFSADDQRPGSERVAVISHALWVHRFSSDPGVINRIVGAGPNAIRIVGVMPPGFTYPVHLPEKTDVWLPLVFSDEERSLSSPGITRAYQVIGRLKEGMTPETASLEVRSISEELLRVRPTAFRDWRVAVRSMRDSLVGETKSMMLLALWAVAFVTAIGCANAANIALSRATARAREHALRAALGASRQILIAGMLVEGLLISTAASLAALVIALWAVGAARAALPDGIALASSIGLNGRVYVFALAAAIATGLGFVTVPAWHASRTDLIGLIRAGAVNNTPARQRWRGIFLSSQLAFVTVLLIAATLVGVSFLRVLQTDLGFQRRGLISATAFAVPGSPSELEAMFGAIPGVTAVGLVAGGSPPLVGMWSASTILTRPDAGSTAPLTAEFRRVSPGYFAASGVPIRQGRNFTDADMQRGHVVVLDEQSAAALFGTEPALGKALRVAGGKTDYVVIGIASTVRLGGPEQTSGPQAYLPATEPAGFNVIMRAGVDPSTVISAAQSIIAKAAPEMAAYSPVVSLDEAFARLTATRRSSAMVMIAFGALALVIGVAGVYGVVSAAVALQTREFGVRLALGASGSQVAGLVLGRTARTVAIGSAIGVPFAASLARASADTLFKTDPLELWIYALVVGVLAITACAAAWVPARRAARVDPITILKTD